MSFNWIKIGERISIQRNELGLTQEDVYEKLDFSQNHYSRIENGRDGISVEKLIQLSDILNISIDYLLKGKIRSNRKSDFEIKYNKLSKKQKQFIIQQIDSLKKFDLK
ncbi:MAG: helix-turn-helix transcriptional regulator [Oscillospiraceae bacterium]|nr:helix-turn-helix transcriptional regulator [Oscillospiraceae bacterium]